MRESLVYDMFFDLGNGGMSCDYKDELHSLINMLPRWNEFNLSVNKI